MPFTPDTISEVVSHHQQPQIQHCYEETLAGDRQGGGGQAETSFVITPEGSVKQAKVVKKGTTLKDPKLHRVRGDGALVMTFPKPPDGEGPPDRVPVQPQGRRS